MKSVRIFSILAILFMAMILLPTSSEAQCSLCKAARDSGGWSTKGLNTGILYLMSIPYIAFTVIAFFWYKSSKKYTQQQKKIAKALKGKDF